MRTNILFLLICFVFKNGYTKNSSSISSRLPDMLQYLCPGAEVCRGNHTIQPPKGEFLPGYQSCCTECSCEPDCEENGNCCFPAKKPFTNGNEDFDETLQQRRVCLYPTTLDVSGPQMMLFQPYYMITSVSSPRGNNSSLSCGDTPVAPWGSLFPVYSAKRNQLYKNIVCATADGVKDAKTLDAFLACNSYFTFSDIVMSNGYMNLSSVNDIFRNCYIMFIMYRGNIKEIQHFKCYRDVIDVCPDSGLFSITDEVVFSKEEIIEACTSGLSSPYMWTKLYANVFCGICNNESFTRSQMCPSRQSVSFYGNSQKGFSGLIDADFFLNDRNKQSLVIRPTIPTACQIQDMGSCRIIHCPSGQMYATSGKCKYMVKVWFDQIFQVYIKLKAEEDVNIIEVLRKNDISVLNSLKNWRVSTIVYYVSNSNEKITYVVVKYVCKVPSIRPTYLISNVKEMIRRDWVFRGNNKKIVLKSEIMNFTFVTIDDSIDYIQIGNRTETFSSPNFITIFTHSKQFTNAKPAILISRLHLCKQIELTHSEFILSELGKVLFNLITRKFMFYGDFTLIKSRNFESFRARICIENSGFVAASQEGISYTHTIVGLFCICVSFSSFSV